MGAYIILKKGNTDFPTQTKKVSHFKALGNFVIVTFTDGTFDKQSNGLKEWENNEYVVSSGDFLRVHESWMLNWRNVKSFERSYAVMDDKEKTHIPLNEEGHKKLKEKYRSRSSSSDPIKFIPLFLPQRKEARNDEEE